MTEVPPAKEVLKQLQHVAANICQVVLELDKNDIPKILAAYKQLNEIKAVVDEVQKLITEQYHSLSYVVIPDAFETHGFDSIKAHGRNFVVSVRINASIPEDMRPVGYKWITETLGIPELIKPTVNPKQLSSAIKDYFEANAMWPPEDAVKVHKQKYTSIRKA